MATRGGAVLLLLLGSCGGIVAVPPAPEVDEQPTGSDESLPPATADGIIALSHRETSTAILPLFRNPSLPSPEGTASRGDCRLAIDAATDDDDDDAFESNASAGIVRARAGERAVELRYDDDIDSYYGRTFPGPGPLSPDVPLEIEATGAAVPAFHTTVELVRPIRVLSSEEGIAADEAFTLTWEPTSDDLDVVIVLGGEGRSLRCLADGRLGSFEIEADRVRSIAGHPLAEDTLSLDVDVERSTELQAGAFAIQVLDDRPSHHATLAIHRITRSATPLRSGHARSIARE